MRRYGAVIATFALACGSASGSQPWFENKREGWFWYNEAIIEEPVESPTEETPVDTTSAADPMLRADIVPQGPAVFSSAWLRENLDDYLETAIDDPTPENVQAFLYLQRLSLDRAERFSDAVSMALVADPALDETTRSPIAPFAANQTPKVVADRRARMLEHISTQAGIFFFFESTCPYCQAQAPVLSRFAAAYGLTVYAVSVDGHALPGGEFPDFRVDRGTAEQLGVINYPAMFRARQPMKVSCATSFDQIFLAIRAPPERRCKQPTRLGAEEAGAGVSNRGRHVTFWQDDVAVQDTSCASP